MNRTCEARTRSPLPARPSTPEPPALLVEMARAGAEAVAATRRAAGAGSVATGLAALVTLARAEDDPVERAALIAAIRPLRDALPE